MSAALRRLAGFAATLRGAGFAVGRAETLDAARLLASPAADRPERLRAALRALFASNPAEFKRFDELFDAFWRGRGQDRAASSQRLPGASEKPRARRRGAVGAGEVSLPDAAGLGAADAASPGRERGASVHEALGSRDFAKLGEAERAQALALAERLARAMCARLKRRAQTRARGRRLDLRRTIRRSVARGGEPFDLRFRKAKRKPLQARRAARRLGLDGALRLAVHPLPARGGADVPRVRRLSVPYAARACEFGARRTPSATRARPALADGRRRRRRHQDRRLPRRVRPPPCQARDQLAHLRDDLLRRLRHRRAGGAGSGDAKPAAALQAHRLARSADGSRRLCA